MLTDAFDISTQYVKPAALPEASLHLNNSTGMISGFGATENKETSENLLVANITIFHDKKCKYDYNLIIESFNFCAGGIHGEDTCRGDSGGPLVIQRHGEWILYGITSSGDDCKHITKPGLYTKVNAFLGDINNTIITEPGK